MTVDPAAVISEDARIGRFVVIHADVTLGAACVVQDGAVVGKEPILGPLSRAAGLLPAPTFLEDGCSIGCGAVLVRGCHIGAGAVIGDHALVREGAHVGAGSVIGHGGAVGAGVLVGRHVRIQNNVVLAPGTVVEDDVLCGPNVTTTDDAFDGRRDEGLRETVLRRGCRIAAGVILLPGVEIGAEAVVGAGSVVTRSVPPRTVSVGSPARVVRTVDAG